MFDKVEDFTKPNGFRINTDNELSNFDIIKIIEDMKLTHVFGGVYSKDQLPTLQRNKFYIINNYSYRDRLMFLNTSIFLIGVLALRSKCGLLTKFRKLSTSCLVGYSVGGLFIVP